MARIVGAFGVPHNPHFPTWADQGDPRAAPLAGLYGGVERELRRVRPDVLFFVTSDHYNVFFESLPIFMLGTAPSARGASDYPTIRPRELELDTELAHAVHDRVVPAGFDVGMLREFDFDHTVIAPLQFLLPDRELPIVPLFVNVFVRPLPAAARCLALGRAIRAALEAEGGDKRVAVVASGSFSVEIGGPRINEVAHVGVPDPAWVQEVLELLNAAEVGTLVARATDEQLLAAGNAGGELLDWIVMLGMFDPRPPVFAELEMEHGHGYVAWPLEPA